MHYTRREFVSRAAVGLPAAAFLLSRSSARGAAAAKPNSTWAGVAVGLNVPYSFGTRTAMNAGDVLAKCIDLGVSHVELRAQAIENSLGRPAELVLGPAVVDYTGAMARPGDLPGVKQSEPVSAAAAGGGAPSRGTAGGRMPRTPEEIAAHKAKAAELAKWRAGVSLAKARELRQQYDAAGVEIGIVKFDGFGDLAGAELDYAFTLAKTLGAHAISGELWLPAAQRLAEAAERHQMFVAHHAHLAGSPAVYEEVFKCGRFSGANLDIGHFVAGNYGSPVPFLEKYHDRITHIHVKDRKKNAGVNVPFGEGDTPIKDVLRTIRDRKWPIQAIVEFEIPLPPGTDRTPELTKALNYCRDCLLG